MKKKLKMREEGIRRGVEAGMVLRVSVKGEEGAVDEGEKSEGGQGEEEEGQGLLVELPSALLDLGRSKKHAFKMRYRVREADDSSTSTGIVDLDVIVTSYWLGREEQELFEKAMEEGGKAVGGDERLEILGLAPDSLHRVHFTLSGGLKENIIEVMEEKRRDILEAEREKFELEINEKGAKASERVMEEVKRSNQIDPTDILQAQKLAKSIKEAGDAAQKVEREMIRARIEKEKYEEKKGEEKKIWETKVRLEWLINWLGGEQWDSGHVDVWTNRTVPTAIAGVRTR